jgi:hypothetical protein
MMTYPNAAAGLKTVYQARLVGLISIVLVIVHCAGIGSGCHADRWFLGPGGPGPVP